MADTDSPGCWNKLTVVVLKDELRSRGLSITGRKADLIKRLEEYENGSVDIDTANDNSTKIDESCLAKSDEDCSDPQQKGSPDIDTDNDNSTKIDESCLAKSDEDCSDPKEKVDIDTANDNSTKSDEDGCDPQQKESRKIFETEIKKCSVDIDTANDNSTKIDESCIAKSDKDGPDPKEKGSVDIDTANDNSTKIDESCIAKSDKDGPDPKQKGSVDIDTANDKSTKIDEPCIAKSDKDGPDPKEKGSVDIDAANDNSSKIDESCIAKSDKDGPDPKQKGSVDIDAANDNSSKIDESCIAKSDKDGPDPKQKGSVDIDTANDNSTKIDESCIAKSDKDGPDPKEKGCVDIDTANDNSTKIGESCIAKSDKDGPDPKQKGSVDIDTANDNSTKIDESCKAKSDKDGSDPKQKVKCPRCNLYGHLAPTCPRNLCRCPNCNRMGHIAKECHTFRTPQGVKCPRCNLYGHLPPTCPRNLCRCPNCNRMGHIAKECHTFKTPQAGSVDIDTANDNSTKIDKSCLAKSDEDGSDPQLKASPESDTSENITNEEKEKIQMESVKVIEQIAMEVNDNMPAVVKSAVEGSGRVLSENEEERKTHKSVETSLLKVETANIEERLQEPEKEMKSLEDPKQEQKLKVCTPVQECTETKNDDEERTAKDDVIVIEDDEDGNEENLSRHSESSDGFGDFEGFVVIDEAGSDDDDNVEKSHQEKEKENKSVSEKIRNNSVSEENQQAEGKDTKVDASLDEKTEKTAGTTPVTTTITSAASTAAPIFRNLCQRFGINTGSTSEAEKTEVESGIPIETIGGSYTPASNTELFPFAWSACQGIETGSVPYGFQIGLSYPTAECGVCKIPGHHFINCPRKLLFCISCSKIGHTQPECPGVLFAGWCQRCKLYGHLPTECPKVFCQCKKCFQLGHTVEECINASAATVMCPRCNLYGHLPSTCPRNYCQCPNCNQMGHIAKECHTFRTPQADFCERCKQVGHLSEKCPRNMSQCLKCGSLGHSKDECFEKPGICPRCNKLGHFMTQCPQKIGCCFKCQERGHNPANCPNDTSTVAKDSSEEEITAELEKLAKEYYGGWTIYTTRQHLYNKEGATTFFRKYDNILDLRMYDYADKIFIGFMSKNGAEKALRSLWNTRFDPKVATINKNFKTSDPPALTMEEYDILIERRKSFDMTANENTPAPEMTKDHTEVENKVEAAEVAEQPTISKYEETIQNELKKLQKDYFQMWNVCINRYTIRNEQIANVVMNRFGKISEIRMYKQLVFVSYMCHASAVNAVRGLWGTEFKPTVPTINTSYKTTIPKALTMEEIELLLECSAESLSKPNEEEDKEKDMKDGDELSDDTSVEDGGNRKELRIIEELIKLGRDYYGAWNIYVKLNNLTSKGPAMKFFRCYGHISEIRIYSHVNKMFIGYMTQEEAGNAVRSLWDTKHEPKVARANPNFKTTVPPALTLEELEILQQSLPSLSESTSHEKSEEVQKVVEKELSEIKEDSNQDVIDKGDMESITTPSVSYEIGDSSILTEKGSMKYETDTSSKNESVHDEVNAHKLLTDFLKDIEETCPLDTKQETDVTSKIVPEEKSKHDSLDVSLSSQSDAQNNENNFEQSASISVENLKSDEAVASNIAGEVGNNNEVQLDTTESLTDISQDYMTELREGTEEHIKNETGDKTIRLEEESAGDVQTNDSINESPELMKLKDEIKALSQLSCERTVEQSDTQSLIENDDTPKGNKENTDILVKESVQDEDSRVKEKDVIMKHEQSLFEDLTDSEDDNMEEMKTDDFSKMEFVPVKKTAVLSHGLDLKQVFNVSGKTEQIYEGSKVLPPTKENENISNVSVCSEAQLTENQEGVKEDTKPKESSPDVNIDDLTSAIFQSSTLVTLPKNKKETLSNNDNNEKATDEISGSDVKQLVSRNVTETEEKFIGDNILESVFGKKEEPLGEKSVDVKGAEEESKSVNTDSKVKDLKETTTKADVLAGSSIKLGKTIELDTSKLSSDLVKSCVRDVRVVLSPLSPKQLSPFTKELKKGKASVKTPQRKTKKSNKNKEEKTEDMEVNGSHEKVISASVEKEQETKPINSVQELSNVTGSDVSLETENKLERKNMKTELQTETSISENEMEQEEDTFVTDNKPAVTESEKPEVKIKNIPLEIAHETVESSKRSPEGNENRDQLSEKSEKETLGNTPTSGKPSDISDSLKEQNKNETKNSEQENVFADKSQEADVEPDITNKTVESSKRSSKENENKEQLSEKSEKEASQNIQTSGKPSDILDSMKEKMENKDNKEENVFAGKSQEDNVEKSKTNTPVNDNLKSDLLSGEKVTNEIDHTKITKATSSNEKEEVGLEKIKENVHKPKIVYKIGSSKKGASSKPAAAVIKAAIQKEPSPVEKLSDKESGKNVEKNQADSTNIDDIVPVYPYILTELLDTKIGDCLPLSRVFVQDMQTKDLLSTYMCTSLMEWANKAACFSIKRGVRTQKTSALLEYHSDKAGSDALRALTVVMGTDVRIVHANKSEHGREIESTFSIRIDDHPSASSVLIAQSVPEGTTDQEIYSLIPISLVVCGPLINTLEVIWPEKSSISNPQQKYLLPDLLKDAYFVQCTSSAAAIKFRQETSSLDFKGKKVQIKLLSEFKDEYVEEFWDICFEKHNVIASHKCSPNLALSDHKRISQCEVWNEKCLDARDDLKKYGFKLLNKRTLEKIMMLKTEINIDSKRRAKAGLKFPEDKNIMTKHTKLLKKLSDQGQIEALSKIVGEVCNKPRPQSLQNKKPKDKDRKEDKDKDRKEDKDKKSRYDKDKRSAENKSRSQSVEKRSQDQSSSGRNEREKYSRKRSPGGSSERSVERKRVKKTVSRSDIYDSLSMSSDSEDSYDFAKTTGTETGSEVQMYVGGLPADLSKHEIKHELMKLFAPYNIVNILRVHYGAIKAYAFVKFATLEDAKRAMKQLNQTKFYDNTIKINHANNYLSSNTTPKASNTTPKVVEKPQRVTKEDREKKALDDMLDRIIPYVKHGWYIVSISNKGRILKDEVDVRSWFSKYGEVLNCIFFQRLIYICFCTKSAARSAIEGLWYGDWNISAVDNFNQFEQCLKYCVNCGETGHYFQTCSRRAKKTTEASIVKEMMSEAIPNPKGYWDVTVDISQKYFRNNEELQEFFSTYGGIKSVIASDKKFTVVSFLNKKPVSKVLQDMYKTSWDARLTYRREPEVREKEEYSRPADRKSQTSKKEHMKDTSKGHRVEPKSLDRIKSDNAKKLKRSFTEEKPKREIDLFSTLEDDLFGNEDVKETTSNKKQSLKSSYVQPPEPEFYSLERLAGILDNLKLDSNNWVTVSIYNEGQLLDEKVIRQMFLKYGEVTLVRLENEKAFVSFSNKASAMKAIEELWGTKWNVDRAINTTWCKTCKTTSHWTGSCQKSTPQPKVDKKQENREEPAELRRYISMLNNYDEGYMIGLKPPTDRVFSRNDIMAQCKKYVYKITYHSEKLTYISFDRWQVAVKALTDLWYDCKGSVFVPDKNPVCLGCRRKTKKHLKEDCRRKHGYCMSCKNFGHEKEQCPTRISCMVCARQGCLDPLHIQIAQNLQQGSTTKTIFTDVKQTTEKPPDIERSGALGGLFSSYKSDVSDSGDDIVDRSLSSSYESEVEDIVAGTDKACEKELLTMRKDSMGYWSVAVSPDPFYNIEKVDVLQKFLKYGKIKDVLTESGTFIVKFKTASRARNAARDMWGTMWKVNIPYIKPTGKAKAKSDGKPKTSRFDEVKTSRFDKVKTSRFDQVQKTVPEKKKAPYKRSRKSSSSDSSSSSSSSSEDEKLRSKKGKGESPWTSKERRKTYKTKDDRGRSRSHSKEHERWKDGKRHRGNRSPVYDSDDSSRSRSTHRSQSMERNLQRSHKGDRRTKYEVAGGSQFKHERSMSPEMKYKKEQDKERDHDADVLDEIQKLWEDYQGLWTISVVNSGDITRREAAEMFAQYGNVGSVDMTRSRIYIGYDTRRAAHIAVYSLWKTKWDGRVAEQEKDRRQDQSQPDRTRSSVDRWSHSKERDDSADSRRRSSDNMTERGVHHHRSHVRESQSPEVKRRKSNPETTESSMVASVLQGLKDVISSKVEELVKTDQGPASVNVVKGLLESIDVIKEKGGGNQEKPSTAIPGLSLAAESQTSNIPTSTQLSNLTSKASDVLLPQRSSHSGGVSAPQEVSSYRTAVSNPGTSSISSSQQYVHQQHGAVPGAQPSQYYPYHHQQPLHYQHPSAPPVAYQHPQPPHQQALPPGWQYYQQTINALGRGLGGGNLLQGARGQHPLSPGVPGYAHPSGAYPRPPRPGLH